MLLVLCVGCVCEDGICLFRFMSAILADYVSHRVEFHTTSNAIQMRFRDAVKQDLNSNIIYMTYSTTILWNVYKSIVVENHWKYFFNLVF